MEGVCGWGWGVVQLLVCCFGDPMKALARVQLPIETGFKGTFSVLLSQLV